MNVLISNHCIDCLWFYLLGTHFKVKLNDFRFGYVRLPYESTLLYTITNNLHTITNLYVSNVSSYQRINIDKRIWNNFIDKVYWSCGKLLLKAYILSFNIINLEFNAGLHKEIALHCKFIAKSYLYERALSNFYKETTNKKWALQSLNNLFKERQIQFKQSLPILPHLILWLAPSSCSACFVFVHCVNARNSKQTWLKNARLCNVMLHKLA